MIEFEGRSVRTDISLMCLAAAFAAVAIRIPGHEAYVSPAFACAVPLLVMAAGTRLLRPAESEPIGAFYRQRVLRLIPALIFWNAVYFRFRYWGEHLSPAQAAGIFWSGGGFYGHMWFLPALLGLYLLVPAVRPWVLRRRRGTLAALLAFAFPAVWLYFALTRAHFDTPPLLKAIPFLAYLVLGYFLDRYWPRSGRWWLWLVLLAALASVVVIAARLPGRSPVGDCFSPTATGLALAVFLLCRNIVPAGRLAPARLRSMAAAALGIYLVHPLVLAVLDRFVSVESLRQTVSTLGLALLVFTASLLLVLSWRYIVAALDPRLSRTPLPIKRIA